MRRKKERSKQGQTKQHSTPKAVKKLPRVGLEPTTLYTLDRAHMYMLLLYSVVPFPSSQFTMQFPLPLIEGEPPHSPPASWPPPPFSLHPPPPHSPPPHPAPSRLPVASCTSRTVDSAAQSAGCARRLRTRRHWGR